MAVAPLSLRASHMSAEREIEAATLIAASARGYVARKKRKRQVTAAVKIQAYQRGRVARRRRFALAEKAHAITRPNAKAHAPAPSTSQGKPLSLKQLGLATGLPSNPVPRLQFLTFTSWYFEMGTKRWMEICFDLETELFQVVLDKYVSVLDSTHVDSPLFDSLQSITSQEKRVLSMHLHEKLSGNQHAESLRRPHLQCWDVHVGARLNILGRPTTLMQCNLDTRKWLCYHSERLTRIKEALQVNLTKYEPVPIITPFQSDRAVKRGQSRGSEGAIDLRQLMNQVEALQVQLSRYRPAIANQLQALASGS